MKDMKYNVLFLLIYLVLLGCNQQAGKTTEDKKYPITGDYFGLTVGDTAEMFAEGIISREYQELNSVFTPDGNEFYYTLADAYRTFYTIVKYTKNQAGEWKGPTVASFSGSYSDADPYITSDGSKLYYISKRPVDINSNEPKDFDIWMVNREGADWSEPTRLGGQINTGGDEYYVSATDDGSIFFASNREGGLGGTDIYEAKLENGSYVAEPLGEAINSPNGEGDAYVSPDNQIMIFFSFGREDDMGGGDLYISFRENDEWQPAKNLGDRINSNQFEYCPMLSPDGKYFFWTSYRSSALDSPEGYNYKSYIDRLESADNGLGNVYWISADILEDYR